VVVGYNTWLLAFLNPYDAPLSGFISELAAVDQPWSWVFRTGDGLAGLLLLLVAGLGRTRWQSRYGAHAGWVAAALAVAGAATIVDVLVAPMACAPTFDADCRALYEADWLGPGFALHTIASVVVPAGVVGSLVFAGLGSRGRGHRGGRYVALVALSLVLGLGTWAIEVTLDAGQGYLQAVQVVLFSLWFGALAVFAASGSGTAAGAGTSRPPGPGGTTGTGRPLGTGSGAGTR
jgi:hypothetical protein